ncbi:MAG TPA: rRNA maturation RNase YbeY [Bdellovibrionota bacterium]|nr:rRNA maturation RNase YbeY [Bdellovibrionota bacterium]
MAPHSRAWQVGVKVVGAAEMRRLNGSYRGKRYATDVLSFPSPEPFRSQGFLGELVVCAPILEKQAADMGHPPGLELEVLLAHGLLHLLGLDHELGPSAASRMGRWERKLLRARGLIARSK